MSTADGGHQMATSRTWLRVVVVAIMSCGVLAIPATTFAQVEVTGVIGGLLGGDLDNLLQGTSSIKSTFENGPLYGARVGWIGKFGGAEGSFVGSPSGVKISLPNRPVAVDGTVYYLEANALLVPIPGPISPFFRAGLGMHSYRLDLEAGTATATGEDIKKLGYNFGGGLKINIGHFTIRGEVVDHITTIGPDDFDLSEVAQELGFNDDLRVHNLEISAGIGIRF
jgi:opacity protein-like surface antigen